jgi:hypothetical protein
VGLKQSVELECPDDLDSAVAAVFDQLSIWSKVDMQTTSSDKTDRKKNGKPDERKSPSGSVAAGSEPKSKKGKAVVCFGCGGSGHIKPECTRKDLWSDTKRSATTVRSEESKPVVAAAVADVNLPNVTARFGDGLKLQMYLDTCASLNIIHPKYRDALVNAGAWLRPKAGSLSTAGSKTLSYSQQICVPVTVVYEGREVTVDFSAVIAENPLGIIASWEWMTSNNFQFSSLQNDCPINIDESLQHEVVHRDAQTRAHNDPKLAAQHDLMLEKKSELFSPDIVLGNSLLPPLKLEVQPDVKLTSHNPRRLAPKMSDFEQRKVSELLRSGVIRKSSSACAAPLVIAPKKGGDYRMCVDFREMNAATKRMSYPLPNTAELLDRLSGKTHFAALDLRDAYHQIPVHSDSQKYLAFVTPDGLYEYTQMPFGITNGASYMQQMLSTIVLPDLIGIACEVFIDDIIVHGRTANEYMVNLKLVLDRLDKYKLRLKREKCKFMLSSVEYLGHVVSSSGVTMSTERRDAIDKMTPPTNTKQLRSFLGLPTISVDT